MKIIDSAAALATIGDVPIGSVVRLANGRLYLIGNLKGGVEVNLPYRYGLQRYPETRVLINLETGLTHRVSNGDTGCTVVPAVLSVQAPLYAD